jgi:hypothetical protein
MDARMLLFGKSPGLVSYPNKETMRRNMDASQAIHFARVDFRYGAHLRNVLMALLEQPDATLHDVLRIFSDSDREA